MSVARTIKVDNGYCEHRVCVLRMWAPLLRGSPSNRM
jgi:hypothetical protein